MPVGRILAIFLASLASFLAGPPGYALAAGQGVVAVVNDQPITERDVSQRISLLKALGEERGAPTTRQTALGMLVDDVIKRVEAKRYGMDATDVEVTKQVERLAGGMKISADELVAKLGKQGINEGAFRSYLAAQIGFNRLIASRYRNEIKIEPADVDRKLAEIKQTADSRMATLANDPRLRPVTVYILLEIEFPIEKDETIAAQLLQSRAVEAATVASRIKGCKSARQAASGVYNVRIGKQIEADASKFPPQLKAALDKAGVGKAIGPMRSKNGLQLIAFCGVQKLTPPKPKFEMPTREQVRAILINEKYDKYEAEFLRDARKKIYVEHRDPSLSQ